MRFRVAWIAVGLGSGFVACSGESFQAAPPSEGDAGERAAAGQPATEPAGEGGTGDVGGAAAGGSPLGGSAPSSYAGAPNEETGGAAGESSGPDPVYSVSELIDDMEDGDSGLLNTNGDWYVLRDNSAGIITPPYGIPFTATELMPARGESKYAAQVTVKGFNGWGASVGFDFNYVNAQRYEYDLHDFQALRFWARATKSVELKLQIPNVDSDPYGNRCLGAEGDNACYDHFSKAFSVGTEWTEVTIPFSSLRQQGTGRRAESFDAHRVFSVFFGIGPKEDVTYAIDDVALVK